MSDDGYICVIVNPDLKKTKRHHLKKDPEAFVEGNAEGRIKQVCYPASRGEEWVKSKIPKILEKDKEGCKLCKRGGTIDDGEDDIPEHTTQVSSKHFVREIFDNRVDAEEFIRKLSILNENYTVYFDEIINGWVVEYGVSANTIQNNPKKRDITSTDILPLVKEYVKAYNDANKNKMKTIANAISKKVGKKVIPYALTEEERICPQLLAKRIVCASQVKKGQPSYNRFAVCRASVGLEHTACKINPRKQITHKYGIVDYDKPMHRNPMDSTHYFVGRWYAIYDNDDNLLDVQRVISVDEGVYPSNNITIVLENGTVITGKRHDILKNMYRHKETPFEIERKASYPIKNLIASESELRSIASGGAPEIYVYVYGTPNVKKRHMKEAQQILRQEYGVIHSNPAVINHAFKRMEREIEMLPNYKFKVLSVSIFPPDATDYIRPEQTKTGYYIGTKPDYEVGVGEFVISPTFSDEMELVRWWDAHKSEIKRACEKSDTKRLKEIGGML